MDINDLRFNKCRDWIRQKRQEDDWSWESLRLANNSNEKELEDFLTWKIRFDSWPKDLNCKVWYQIVDEYREVQEMSSNIKYITDAITVSDIEENYDIFIPSSPENCWTKYKEHLAEKGFNGLEINRLEKSCFETLKRLRYDTTTTGPIKGLVVGNVQSGKTANMAGLMAMAADFGWNLFIILSGTIENLRKQTQDRFAEDLQDLESNLAWQGLEHLSSTSQSIYQLSHLSLAKTSKIRYYTVCLKVKKRLEDLIDWIQADPKKLDQLKVLVIDDEADQASINTSKMLEDEEEKNRKAINRLIINLVHFRDKNSKSPKDPSLPVKAMNYISYTATPYANCLNESGKDTLYPEHFIHCLVPSQKYIGPSQMYKAGDIGRPTLNITRIIEQNDVEAINAILKRTSDVIPSSLEDSILWFIVSAASMRCYKSTKPVSMLIHLSQKQTDHSVIAELITKWFDEKRNHILTLCRQIYDRETKLFPKKSFRQAYSEYAREDEDIPDYPAFEDLVPHIKDLVKEVSYIKMTDKNLPKYKKSMHLCIDNSNNNGLTEEGDHIRLIYPDSHSAGKSDFAPAFIVIGGNTLARGLTLQGLTSTYFHRNVLQADTLMQMARWFGYRVNYELLPRVWMSTATEDKFNFLTELDEDLRKQLFLLQSSGMKPLDFEVSIKTSPKAKFLLTAKNKMQEAKPSDVDCSGMDTQLTTYSTELEVLEKNLEATDAFLQKLGKGKPSESTCAYYWDDVDYETINKYFFKKGFSVHPTSRTFQNLDLVNDWVKKETAKGNMTKWSVICAGTAPAEDPDKNWTMPDGFRVGKVERSPKAVYSDHIGIGVLSSKKDYLSDIQKSMLDSATWKEMQTSNKVSSNYEFYRKQAGLENKPILVLYRIDKDSNKSSEDKKKLSLKRDLIGVAMVTPGIREKKHTVTTRVKIKHIKESESYDEY